MCLTCLELQITRCLSLCEHATVARWRSQEGVRESERRCTLKVFVSSFKSPNIADLAIILPFFLPSLAWREGGCEWLGESGAGQLDS